MIFSTPKLTVSEDKRRVLTECLALGMTAIAFDSRQPGVDAPEHSNPCLMLNFSYRFEGVQLELSDWGIRCRLSFSGVNHPIQIPWAALLAARCVVGDRSVGAKWDPPPEPIPLTKRRGILGLVS